MAASRCCPATRFIIEVEVMKIAPENLPRPVAICKVGGDIVSEAEVTFMCATPDRKRGKPNH